MRRNDRSRCRGMSGHDAVEWAVTIARSMQFPGLGSLAGRRGAPHGGSVCLDRCQQVRSDSVAELGLGQYQGRLYPGLQHHLSAVICTCAFIVAERERASADSNPIAAPMQRTVRILQRHSQYSIATLRKQHAFAPWPVDYREAPQRRRGSLPNPTPVTGQASTTGG